MGFHVVVGQEATQNSTTQRYTITTDATQTQINARQSCSPSSSADPRPLHPVPSHSTVSRSRSLPSILSINQSINSFDSGPSPYQSSFPRLVLMFLCWPWFCLRFTRVKSSSFSRCLLISTTITSPFHQQFHTLTDQVHSAISRPILISPCVHTTY